MRGVGKAKKPKRGRARKEREGERMGLGSRGKAEGGEEETERRVGEGGTAARFP
jgi:hypothetical protein